MKRKSFAAFCMRLRMHFLAWRAQRRGELPPDEVFFYRFNQREGLNTQERAFWAAQAQLAEMGGALPRPARRAYMPAYGAQAYMPAYEVPADARAGSDVVQPYMPAYGAQAYMPAQVYAVCARQGSVLRQAFASDDRQRSAQPRMIGRVYTRYKNYL